MKTYSVDDLSVILKKSKSSIYSDASRNPSVLPPILRIPGSKKLLFVGVEEWMERFTVVAIAPDPNQARLRLGAPTKRERLMRARLTCNNKSAGGTTLRGGGFDE
jgi:hypothetical protein